MSYQVLARKWRPKLFTEVVGQNPVLKILTNALSLGRVHHAYLFSGTRGVGKTSIARLLAKSLNCETGSTAVPCCQCGNCQEIEQGRFVDLIEIDAASRTKVEDTREILDNIQYLPTRGRFKVYLIDEVHMLSRSSFNALLKTLEEPPNYVKFLLATTDPQKLPVTILSRCLHLHLNTIDNIEITKQLEHILQLEKIHFQTKATQLLAKNANGSMRDALSLTDQAIAIGNGQIDTESVMTMLGTLDDDIPFFLVESLLNADGQNLMVQLTQVARQGTSFEAILVDTLHLLHQIAMLQLVPTALGEYQHKEEHIRYLAQMLTPQDIQLYYQILLEGKKALDMVDDKKMSIEMTFLRALAFQPKLFQETQRSITAVENTRLSLSAAKSAPEHSVDLNTTAKKVANHIVTEVTVQNDDSPTISKNETSTESNLSAITKQILKAREKLTSKETTTSKKFDAPCAQTIKSFIEKSRKRDDAEAITTHAQITQLDKNYQYQTETIVVKEINNKPGAKHLRKSIEQGKTPDLITKLTAEAGEIDSWSAEIEALDLTPIAKQLAINTFLEEKENHRFILHLRSSQAHINRKNHCDNLQTLLSAHRNLPVTLQVIIDDDPSKQTPLELRDAIYQKKLAVARKTILGDEKIALLCEYFDAQIDEESIHPV